MSSAIHQRLDEIEKEVKSLKNLLKKKSKIVSLRGMGKLKVSEKELEAAITEAKKATFGKKNVLD